MFNWIASIFKKKESPVQQARRLGMKYLRLIRATTGKPHTNGDMMCVIEVSSDNVIWIPIEEYNRSEKEYKRDFKLKHILDKQ